MCKNIKELLEKKGVKNFSERGLMAKFQKEIAENKIITRETLYKIVKWKTESEKAVTNNTGDRPPAKKARENEQKDINAAIDCISKETSVEKQINRLARGRNKLKGVGVPVASAILTALYPKKYAVIDFRVWRVLCKYDLVEPNNCGREFRAKQYVAFLSELTSLAKEFKVTPRAVERTLWEYDKNKSGRV